jgi:NarL family two-component system response regulator LiaR
LTSVRTAVIVDEHPLWLDAVEQVLQRISVEVLGKATSLSEATRLIDELNPDLLVAEVATSEGEVNGFSWLTETCQRFRDLRAIVLSISDDPADIASALSAGAAVYVVKKAHPDDLAVAVRQAYEHSIYLAGYVPTNEPAVAAEPRLDHPDLTRREVEILRLVAEGLSNAELAKMLWVTEQTVKFHLSNIYRKLNVSNRTEASRWAQVHGLLPAQPIRSGAA